MPVHLRPRRHLAIIVLAIGAPTTVFARRADRGAAAATHGDDLSLGGLSWTWSGPSSIEESHIGVVLAAANPAPGVVFVYGVLGQSARQAMRPKAADPLQCGLVRLGDAAPTLAAAPVSTTSAAVLFEGYARPDFYWQRYGVRHPETYALPNRSRYPATPVLARFECKFVDLTSHLKWPPTSREPLHLTLGTKAWQLPPVLIRPSATLLSDRGEAPIATTTTSTVPAALHQARHHHSLHGSAHLSASVSVCVNKIYAPGPSAREWIDFVSWYLLLGARRIVVFESLEPNGTAIARAAVARASERATAGGVGHTARVEASSDGERADPAVTAQRRSVLHALKRTLGSRFVVVPAFCDHEVMYRATPNMHCQVLAGNMCIDATTATTATDTVAYALHVDTDEYLTPPVGAAASTRAREDGNSTATGAERHDIAGWPAVGAGASLEGALPRLARALERRGSAESAAARGPAAAAAIPTKRRGVGGTEGVDSTGDAGGPGGACLKFGAVFYHPAEACGGVESARDIDMRPPAVVRLSARGTTDSFEKGPSTSWRTVMNPNWDNRVRAKFLWGRPALKSQDKSLMAVHTCCVPVKRGAVKQVGVPESACAGGVRSAPLESWHLRHLKKDRPCREAPPKAMIEPQHALVESPIVAAPLPRAWEDEYLRARRGLADALRPLLGDDVDAYQRVATIDFHPDPGAQMKKTIRG